MFHNFSPSLTHSFTSIVATPGRFLHVLVEMELKLHSLQYVVFDEADRLFEMGFSEQLHEIIRRLPEMRYSQYSITLNRFFLCCMCLAFANR